MAVTWWPAPISPASTSLLRKSLSRTPRFSKPMRRYSSHDVLVELHLDLGVDGERDERGREVVLEERSASSSVST